MKTRCGKINLTGRVTILRLGAGLLAPFAFGTTLTAAPNLCGTTASKVRDACLAAAEGDRQLAVAKCNNLSDANSRQTCRNQAEADSQDAKQTCREQYSARVAACRRLGPDRYNPAINPANFVQGVNNPYFPLPPGTTYVYEGQTADGLEHSEFAVTHNTRTILGVTCIEVRDTVKVNGVVTEETLDWFAQDTAGNVWYFGENTHELVDGLITSIDGTFMAGVEGAKPGIIMKAHPAVGDFYRQEFALANAEDFAETVAVNESVTVGSPPHTYTNCIKSRETTPLETDLLEFKYYAPNVGNVLTVDGNTGHRIELIAITTN